MRQTLLICSKSRGNLWQGAAIWQLPESARAGQVPLSGSLDWQWQPWRLFLGKLGGMVDITTGQSRLSGEVSVGRASWQVSDLSGRITPDTLRTLVSWELPDAPIQVNSVSLTRESDAGYTEADGQLTWVGGEMGYPSGNRVYRLLLPSMRADLSVEDKAEQSLLHASLLDSSDKRLGDFYLDADNMLDVSLTQRLLETMPDYNGSAPQDTAVVTLRQPLLSTTSVGGR